MHITISTADSVHENSPIKTSGSSVLLWFREDLPREHAKAYWLGNHAQLVARNPSFLEYRQHHFAKDSSGKWPTIESVETTIPAERRIDGMPEVRTKGLLSSLLHSSYNRDVLKDEVNVFGRSILYIAMPGSGVWFRSGYDQPVEHRVVALFRKRSHVTLSEFKKFINEELGPELNKATGILELRSHVFIPWKQSHWDAPGVAHDNPEDKQFHASVVMGARSSADLACALAEVSLSTLRSRFMEYCEAIHAYDVEGTYTFRREGRPTLPQVKPEKLASIDPVKREVLPAPDRSALTQSSLPLTRAVKLPISGAEPEDVISDRTGRLICGVSDGRILRIDPISRMEETLCSTGGRPLGLELAPDGRLLICDAHKGLLAYDFATRALTSLVQFVDTVPLRFCSNATMAQDGTIWFTESTTRFDLEQYAGSFIEHRPSGRLLRRDPEGQVTVVLRDLYFPNGISLNSDETAVLFVETAGYRLNRLWVKGERTGELEVLVDNLPGLPDNMSRIEDGRLWVAMVANRDKKLDSLAKSPGLVRKLLWPSLAKAKAAAQKTVWAMAFDEDGNVLVDLQRSDLQFGQVTGVAECNGKLYFSTIAPHARALLEVDLPASFKPLRARQL